jgi:putative membrane protein
VIAMMVWHGGWGWGAWLATSLVMLLFWGLIIAGVIAVVRSWRPGSHDGRGGSSDALRLLDERFARGEIDEDEYRKRRDLLAGR